MVSNKCSYCGVNFYDYGGFCDDNCFRKMQFVTDVKIKKFINTLSDSQKNLLLYLLNEWGDYQIRGVDLNWNQPSCDCGDEEELVDKYSQYNRDEDIIDLGIIDDMLIVSEAVYYLRETHKLPEPYQLNGRKNGYDDWKYLKYFHEKGIYFCETQTWTPAIYNMKDSYTQKEFNYNNKKNGLHPVSLILIKK